MAESVAPKTSTGSSVGATSLDRMLGLGRGSNYFPTLRGSIYEPSGPSYEHERRSMYERFMEQIGKQYSGNPKKDYLERARSMIPPPDRRYQRLGLEAKTEGSDKLATSYLGARNYGSLASLGYGMTPAQPYGPMGIGY